MKETLVYWAFVATLAAWAVAGILRSIQIWRELRDTGDEDSEDEGADPPPSPHHQIDPDFDPADWWKRGEP